MAITADISDNATGETIELSALHNNGNIFPIELSLSIAQQKGEQFVITVIRDISERKKAEEEQLKKEKMQGVVETAGAICHELNQPLQAILGYSELLMMSKLESNELLGDLEGIKKQTKKMGEITNKLMKITRYETKEYIDGKRIIDIDKAIIS